MSTGYVFVFVCALFTCDRQTMEGDSVYYDTKIDCTQAARGYATQRKINLVRWEIACVERERPHAAFDGDRVVQLDGRRWFIMRTGGEWQ